MDLEEATNRALSSFNDYSGDVFAVFNFFISDGLIPNATLISLAVKIEIVNNITNVLENLFKVNYGKDLIFSSGLKIYLSEEDLVKSKGFLSIGDFTEICRSFDYEILTSELMSMITTMPIGKRPSSNFYL